MTRAETIAFNAGVSVVLALARRAADALASKRPFKPTRHGFAIAALDAVAEEGRALLLPMPPRPMTILPAPQRCRSRRNRWRLPGRRWRHDELRAAASAVDT